MFDAVVALWDAVLFKPILTGLIVLYSVFFENFGLAIIVLTIIVRVVTLPLTLKQVRSSKKMMALQPRLRELQKKYSKDKQRLSQETMKLYKEAGVSPLGCLAPLLVQLPIWIALFYSIRKALYEADLAGYLYLQDWSVVKSVVPNPADVHLNSSFLWMDLATPDVFLMPFLVGGTMWVAQKMMSMPTADPKQASMNRMMLWMMPVMFAFICFTFPSGLAIYFLISNLIQIVVQYFVSGWGSLTLPALARPAAKLETGQVSSPSPESEDDQSANNVTPKPAKRRKRGRPRSKRKDRRGSYQARPGSARGESVRSRGRGSSKG